MAALIPKGTQSSKKRDLVVLLGDGLKDAREEMFIVMVCDGLSMRMAFARAGFESKSHDAPIKLFQLPRIQERAKAILDARRTTGVLSLAEVTDMLKRVFAGAQSAEEYSAAHNAAFSLARLYGHVTDKATLEVIRRPSRDPDAPAEQMLEAWAASLPLVGSQGPEAGLPLVGSQGPEAGLSGPRDGAPASLLGLEPSSPSREPIAQPDVEIDWFEGSGPGDGWGEIGNGAPTRLVIGTPISGGHSTPLGKTGPLLDEKGTVSKWPSFEQLFGERECRRAKSPT